MKRYSAALGIAMLVAGIVGAQGFEAEPVFGVDLVVDREPPVAGSDLRLAVILEIDRGWHVNSHRPGDEWSVPTTLAWVLPSGWDQPRVEFPPGAKLKFDFSDTAIEVWEGRVVLPARARVPEGAAGPVTLAAEVTAQACNNTECLPPTTVRSALELQVAPAGSSFKSVNQEVFASAERQIASAEPGTSRPGPSLRLPWPVPLLLIVFATVALLIRPFHGSPLGDRAIRLLCAGVIVIGVVLLPVRHPADREHLDWQPYDGSAVAAALAAGQPVILDFFADWCAPCRELDEKTFAAAKVAERLRSFARFKVDLTQASEVSNTLRREYGVLGVPTVIVFEGGEEAFRITGFEPADRFLGRLGGGSEDSSDVGERLASAALPWQILLVFVFGLALNGTPCVYPLIPITVGFFSRQAEERTRGSFGLALVYVLGMSVTYSVLGVGAALTGQLFGAALQHPLVIAVLVVVILALAASMFGAWELRVPNWAMRASGGRSGYLGALLMGLMVGFVAAPCIGPFVLSLLTYVGQKGNPLLGFVLFFTLAMGLGLPYLVLGTFTGLLNRLPASGAWMIGVRKIFGVLLLALAVHFAKPMMAAWLGSLLMGLVLVAGGAYLLLVERVGFDQPAIDRVMRVVTAGLIAAGVLTF